MGNTVSLSEMGLSKANPQQDPKSSQLMSQELAESYAEELVDYFQSLSQWRVIGGKDMGGEQVSLDGTREAREHYVKRSRTLVRKEPLSKQAVRLYTTYSGILNVAFSSDKEQAEQLWREKFWQLPSNKVVLSSLHRRKLSLRLLTDGELFLALFPAPNGEVLIRSIDPLEIPDGNIITDPEDADTPVYYKRDSSTALDTKDKVGKSKYYVDWNVSPEARSRVDKTRKDKISPEKVGNEEVVIFHVAFDALGLRGNGLLFAVLSYVENFRNFLQDRATIVRGLSTYIRTITVDGGSKAVKDVASRFRSAIALGSGIDYNPPDSAGSTYVQNRATDKQDTPPVTNSGDAVGDSRIFRQPIASGVGITEANLTGDPSIGNLASQTQMEGPQLRNFEDYQRIWEEVFKELWQYILERNNFDTKNIQLTIKLPKIVKEPLVDLSGVLASAIEAELIPHEEAARLLLNNLGISDVDRMLKQIMDEKEEKAKKAEAMQQQMKGKKEDEEEPDDEEDTAEEFDSPVVGVCALCNDSNHLYESHGVYHCTNCGQTYNPLYYEDQAKIAGSNLAEALE